MFKKLFKRFAKKTETKLPDGAHRIEVDRAEINRVKIDKIKPDEDSVFVAKFRDTTTGEIVKFHIDDREKFNECMSNKNMQMIFD